MKNLLQIFFVLLIIVAFTGCGQNCKVTGKVTLKDGAPLTAGKVVFETDSMFASGWIQKDGSYKLGTIDPGDGVPPGTYRVSISQSVEPILTERPPARAGGQPRMSLSMPPLLFDDKYAGGRTSGLTCTVSKSMTYDITLDPPSDTKKK